MGVLKSKVTWDDKEREGGQNIRILGCCHLWTVRCINSSCSFGHSKGELFALATFESLQKKVGLPKSLSKYKVGL